MSEVSASVAAEAVDPSQAAPTDKAVTAASQSNGVFLGLSLSQAIVTLSWPVLLIVALYVFYLNTRLQTLEAGIRSRPAIKVVNVADTMRGLIQGGLTADQAITHASARFQKYADAGYIVIDNNAVMAAPKETKAP